VKAIDSHHAQDDVLVVGRIASPFGVRGWLRITAFTAVAESLLEYSPWYLKVKGQWQAVEPLAGRHHGTGLVVQLKDCHDRDAAAALTGTDIGIYRSQLPPADADEYYWSDLIGMQVITKDDRVLGVVDHLFETGANDVIVVKGEQEYLVPYIKGQVVKSVDLEARIIRVEWDPDF
jgi:16S rRNA processing protein RimM